MKPTADPTPTFVVTPPPTPIPSQFPSSPTPSPEPTGVGTNILPPEAFYAAATIGTAVIAAIAIMALRSAHPRQEKQKNTIRILPHFSFSSIT